MRPITSDDPPAPNGTTSVSGRDGQSCARAGWAVKAIAIAPPKWADATHSANKVRAALINLSRHGRLCGQHPRASFAELRSSSELPQVTSPAKRVKDARKRAGAGRGRRAR